MVSVASCKKKKFQVRKQPPWPAKIIAAISKDTFYILFYGKSETLEEVTVENMWKYEENCDVFSEKYKNANGYTSAMLNLCLDIDDMNSKANQASVDVSKPEENDNVPRYVHCCNANPEAFIKNISADIPESDDLQTRSEVDSDAIMITVDDDIDDLNVDCNQESVDVSKPEENGNFPKDVACCNENPDSSNKKKNFSADSPETNNVSDQPEINEEPSFLPPTPPPQLILTRLSPNPSMDNYPPQDHTPGYLRPTVSSSSKQKSPCRIQTSPNSSPCHKIIFNSLASPGLKMAARSHKIPSTKRIKVRVMGHLFLVPIPADGERLRVSWLSKEAARRYCGSQGMGKEPVLKLTTTDGAELDQDDFLIDLLIDTDEILESQVLNS